MGDTVVKSIKDFTIWIGEVSVLPSEHGGPLERLMYGVSKATAGKIDMKKGQELESGDQDREADDDFRRFQELNPGLIRMYPEQETGRHHSKKLIRQGNELASVFEQSEKQEEADAHKRGDQVAEGKQDFVACRVMNNTDW